MIDKDKKIRQPRLSVRELEKRRRLIIYAWKEYKSELTMEEIANIFRMPIAQFYNIVKPFRSKT